MKVKAWSNGLRNVVSKFLEFVGRVFTTPVGTTRDDDWWRYDGYSG